MRKKPTYAGLIEYRKNRVSKHFVGLYIAKIAGMDDYSGKYATVCEYHGTILNHQTRKLASSHMADAWSWCEDCRKETIGGDCNIICDNCGQESMQPDLHRNQVCWRCSKCFHMIPNIEVQEFEASLMV